MAAKGFNLLCRQQPWASERLSAYAGKTIRICLGGFQASFTISSEGYLAKADDAVIPNVTLHIVPERMGPGLMEANPTSSMVVDVINIEGEAGLAQVVSDLSRDLRPDVEDALSRWVGDVAAVRLVSGAGSLFQLIRQSAMRFGDNVKEYLTDEDPQIVPHPDLAHFTAQQHALAQRLERVSTRSDQLSQRIDRLASASRPR